MKSRDVPASIIASLLVNGVLYLWVAPAVQAYSLLGNYLVPWSIWLNFASLAMILALSWAKGQGNFRTLLALDLASSLMPCLMLVCVGVANLNALGDWLGIVYLAFVFSKAAVLTLHATRKPAGVKSAALIAVAIAYLWLIPYRVYSPSWRLVIPWMLTLNLVSLGTLAVSGAWAGWRRRFDLLLWLDFAASVLAFVVGLFGGVTGSKGSLPDFGYVYIGLVALKAAALLFHAISNCEQAGRPAWLKAFVFLVSLIVYAGLTPWIESQIIASGDEPHYLLIAHSLFHDRDLNLANNYARDYGAYYPGQLPDHHTLINWRGEEVPVHDIGLPIILVPGVAIGGRLGANLEMSLLGAFMALGLFELAMKFAPSARAALLTTAAFAFTSPLIVFTSQIYPEIPGAACVMWAVLAFEKYKSSSRPIYLWLTGGLLAALPWLNIRYWFVLIAIVLIISLRIVVSDRSSSVKKRMGDLVCLGLPILAATLGYAMIGLRFYGIFLPNAGYFLKDAKDLANTRARTALLALLGLIFDRARGLLVTTPIYLVAIAGIAIGVKRNRWLRWTLVAPALCLFASSCNYYWEGGFSAPSRYILVSGAMLAPFAAAALCGRSLWPANVLLAGMSLYTALAYFNFPLLRFGYTDTIPLSQSVLDLVGIDFGKAFPSLVLDRPLDFWLVGLWTVVGTAYVLATIRVNRDLPERGLAGHPVEV